MQTFVMCSYQTGAKIDAENATERREGIDRSSCRIFLSLIPKFEFSPYLPERMSHSLDLPSEVMRTIQEWETFRFFWQNFLEFAVSEAKGRQTC